jgi:hypothetical protein
VRPLALAVEDRQAALCLERCDLTDEPHAFGEARDDLHVALGERVAELQKFLFRHAPPFTWLIARLLRSSAEMQRTSIAAALVLASGGCALLVPNA